MLTLILMLCILVWVCRLGLWLLFLPLSIVYYLFFLFILLACLFIAATAAITTVLGKRGTRI